MPEPPPVPEVPPVIEAIRRRVGAPEEPTRATALRDLEAAKFLAFERGNPAGALRAIAMQADAAGALREIDPSDCRDLSDDELIAKLAEGDENFARVLRENLPRRPRPAG